MKTKKIILIIFIVFSICIVLPNVLAACDYIILSHDPYSQTHKCGNQTDKICPEDFKDLSGASPVCYSESQPACNDIDCKKVFSPPGIFGLSHPLNKSSTNTTPVLNWTTSEGVTYYILYVDDEPSFTAPYKFFQNIGNVNTFQIRNQLEQDKTYFWKVVAHNNTGERIASNAPFRFITNLSEFPCNITNANILKIYCTGESGSCKVGNNITINISVENMTLCNKYNINKIELYARDIGSENPGDPCQVFLTNSTFISKTYSPGFGGSFYSNWTIQSISQKCAGRDMNASKAALYNGTSSSNQIGEKIGSFGTFSFAGTPIPNELFNLSIDTCGDGKSQPTGTCNDFSVHGNIGVNGTSWGLAPKWKMNESGWKNISFGSIPPGEGLPWYKPSNILYNLLSNSSVLGIYTKVRLDKATIIVFARNEDGEFINALIRIWNESSIVASGNNQTLYEYDGNLLGWPATFTIEFRNVASYYITPENISFSLTGNGIYVFNGIYQSFGSQPCFCSDGTPCESCKGTTGHFCQAIPGQNVGEWVNNACSLPHQCPCAVACNEETGYCQGNSLVCHNSETASTCQSNSAFCFWDLGREIPLIAPYHCEACHAVNNIPTVCGDYRNVNACQKTLTTDACGIGASCPGAPAGARDCACVWQSNACQLSFNLSSGGGNGGNNPQSCILNITVGQCGTTQCGTNKKQVIYDYSDPFGSPLGSCALQDKQTCVRCGVAPERMPFFMPWQILIVLGLLAAYYSFFIVSVRNRKRL
jgi:hypothetical protein